jgi:hypothetical protein
MNPMKTILRRGVSVTAVGLVTAAVGMTVAPQVGNAEQNVCATPSVGGKFAPKGTACKATDPCVYGAACDGAGHCAGGTKLTCAGAGNECFQQTCNGTSTCQTSKEPDGTPCQSAGKVGNCASGVCKLKPH